ncbi:DUF4128 domain-containing protein [Methylobacterium sp. ARG-1]|uniref:DUF4128 domain-containing protein n=1 Tax=Methylobacterium sp. ARG-1 TaxID=1692501 RepID=UPI00067FFD3D|nr:DUF4128 domain-containing protein [Methylobacterium sp. ARG-1]KNY21591.1 hypothetical protein AKJ13_15165 [Methylobacterium sp. ARG-1]
MAIEVAIQAALYDHLKGTTLPTALPIAPEGKNFDPKGKAYLRPTFMPADTTSDQLADDGCNLYTGLFQIDVFWPVDKGLPEPLAVAAALTARFRRGQRIGASDLDLRIQRPPSVMPALQEASWLQVPVRVTWEAIADNPVT